MTIDWNNSSILITGGSSGIGHALAIRLLDRGNRVMVTGRNTDKLDRVVAHSPNLMAFQNDVSLPSERERLVAHVIQSMPNINVIINNAGIQRRVSLAADAAPWGESQVEIDTIFSAPVHLNRLLIPTLISQTVDTAIVNVTSGGAFFPQPFAPIYSASKAALHSYTVNLRFALRETNCRVVELIPPAVQTGLAGPNASHGAPLDDFADSAFKALTDSDANEIGYGPTSSEDSVAANRFYEKMFGTLATRFPVSKY